MSKLSVLIAALILGTSSAAMASPGISFSGNASVRTQASFGTAGNYRTIRAPAPVIRDHRDARALFRAPVIAPVRRPMHDKSFGRLYRPRYEAPKAWMTIGTVHHTVEAGTPMVFNLNTRNGRYSELLLRSDAGKSRILNIALVYANGTSEILHIDQYVMADPISGHATNPTLSIDLSARVGLSQVLINGMNARDSSLSVMIR